MHKITSDQFKAAVELDPAWASKLTEPVEITDFCNMMGSKITHLSPLLHFTGKNGNGSSAAFFKCSSLGAAEGTFEGFVDFSYSSIEKIGDLSCGTDGSGNSAYFRNCSSLKIAKGKFLGYVAFWNSGIEKIGELSCEKDNQGFRLDVTDCPNLKLIPTTFDPKEIYADPELLEKLEVDRFIQKRRAEIVETEI